MEPRRFSVIQLYQDSKWLHCPIILSVIYIHIQLNLILLLKNVNWFLTWGILTTQYSVESTIKMHQVEWLNFFRKKKSRAKYANDTLISITFKNLLNFYCIIWNFFFFGSLIWNIFEFIYMLIKMKTWKINHCIHNDW